MIPVYSEMIYNGFLTLLQASLMAHLVKNLPIANSITQTESQLTICENCLQLFLISHTTCSRFCPLCNFPLGRMPRQQTRRKFYKNQYYHRVPLKITEINKHNSRVHTKYQEKNFFSQARPTKVMGKCVRNRGNFLSYDSLLASKTLSNVRTKYYIQLYSIPLMFFQNMPENTGKYFSGFKYNNI